MNWLRCAMRSRPKPNHQHQEVQNVRQMIQMSRCGSKPNRRHPMILKCHLRFWPSRTRLHLDLHQGRLRRRRRRCPRRQNRMVLFQRRIRPLRRQNRMVLQIHHRMQMQLQHRMSVRMQHHHRIQHHRLTIRMTRCCPRIAIAWIPRRRLFGKPSSPHRVQEWEMSHAPWWFSVQILADYHRGSLTTLIATQT